jgi:hypothetical protein
MMAVVNQEIKPKPRSHNRRTTQQEGATAKTVVVRVVDLARLSTHRALIAHRKWRARWLNTLRASTHTTRGVERRDVSINTLAGGCHARQHRSTDQKRCRFHSDRFIQQHNSILLDPRPTHSASHGSRQLLNLRDHVQASKSESMHDRTLQINTISVVMHEREALLGK